MRKEREMKKYGIGKGESSKNERKGRRKHKSGETEENERETVRMEGK